ncbi:secreted protein [Melampsora americana]|nr:secreted protein [Melampsora americana]
MHSSLQQTLLMSILLFIVIRASPFPNPQNNVITPVENPAMGNQINSLSPLPEYKAEEYDKKESNHKKDLSEIMANNLDVVMVNQIVKRLSQDGLSSEEIISLARNGTQIELQEAKHRTYLAQHPIDQIKREENDQASKKIEPLVEQIEQHFNSIAHDPSKVKENLAEINRLRTEAFPLVRLIISNAAFNSTRS